MKKKLLKIFLCTVVLVAVSYLIWSLVSNLFETPIKEISKKIGELTIETPQQIEADKIVIVKEIQNISRLETVTNSYEQLFESRRDEKRWFGLCAEYLTFIAYGEVVAGIDLSKFDISDITFKDNTVYIKLPPATIFYSLLKPESHMVSHSSKVFCVRDLDMETEVRQTAVEYFQNYAISNNILENAYNNATEIVKSLVLNLEKSQASGIRIKKVIFVKQES